MQFVSYPLETRQLCLTFKSGWATTALDEVMHLRQDALRDFSAHELSEDLAADSFLEMCHALSDKINAKLTRQRLGKGFSDLTAAIREKNSVDQST